MRRVRLLARLQIEITGQHLGRRGGRAAEVFVELAPRAGIGDDGLAAVTTPDFSGAPPCARPTA